MTARMLDREFFIVLWRRPCLFGGGAPPPSVRSVRLGGGPPLPVFVFLFLARSPPRSSLGDAAVRSAPSVHLCIHIRYAGFRRVVSAMHSVTVLSRPYVRFVCMSLWMASQSNILDEKRFLLLDSFCLPLDVRTVIVLMCSITWHYFRQKIAEYRRS